MEDLDKKMTKYIAEQNKKTKKMDREASIQELKESLADFKENVGSKISYCMRLIKAHFEDKKDDKTFQQAASEEYREYLKMHNDSKVGTIEKVFLPNGGIKVVVFTIMGPIIKTIEPADGSQKQIEDQALDQDWFHARNGQKITYQGFCSWIDTKRDIEHFYYAKLTRMTTRKQGVKPQHKDPDYVDNYYGLERQDNGRFKRVYATRNDLTPMVMYDDLNRAFTTAYRNALNQQNTDELQNI